MRIIDVIALISLQALFALSYILLWFNMLNISVLESPVRKPVELHASKSNRSRRMLHSLKDNQQQHSPSFILAAGNNMRRAG